MDSRDDILTHNQTYFDIFVNFILGHVSKDRGYLWTQTIDKLMFATEPPNNEDEWVDT